ncbi:hypothetical protein BKA70DRAFT_678961 [Coprinopsis sp. MPI-PUGE-AT-0042]|nr:hypothetical protein BKA70DRAFT_678961 [Coprinopsis sp. MPI-PUGE-AT-0042]
MAFPFTCLPPELQAHIFELSVDGDPENAPNLSPVSRSAATWVHPRMFHTIAIQVLPSLRSLQLKSSEFLHLHVKRLCITFDSMSMDDASNILSTCTGVVDLAFWLAWPEGKDATSTVIDKPSMARVLSNLPLRRIELPYEQLIEIERESLHTGSLPGWCTTLTHLEILYWGLSYKGGHILVPLLQNLSALTHLGLDWRIFTPSIHEQVDIASFLEMKPLFQVVLVETDEGQVLEDHTSIDIRIVYMTEGEDPVKEWVGRGSKANKWTLAEEEVARRRHERRRQEGKEVSELVKAMQNVKTS